MQKEYRLVNDPLFYIMLVFFALLTTALPASLGQPRFLPVAQTMALFGFLLVPMRQRLIHQALWVMVIWLIVQCAVISILTWLVPLPIEQAIGNGFFYREAYLQWFFGRGLLPNGLAMQPTNRIIELVGITLGSLVSGGLVGLWFFVNAINLTGFSIGSLVAPLGGFAHLLGALPLWTLARLVGYACAVVGLAEPLLTRNWAARYYATARRQLMLAAIGLIALGLLLELILPGTWRAFFAPHIPGKL